MGTLLWIVIIVLVILWLSGLFWSEHKFKLPEDRQLDPHPDRNCHHTHHIAPSWSVVELSRSFPKPSESRVTLADCSPGLGSG